MSTKTHINKAGRQQKYEKWQVCRLFMMLAVCLLMSVNVYAQFMRVNLQMDSETGMEQTDPFLFKLVKEPEKGLLMYEGSGRFCISGNENLQVQVTVDVPGTLQNELNQSLPLKMKMSYINDDGQKLLNTFPNNSDQASFPLNNSGLLIENMQSAPSVLKAFLVLEALTGTAPNLTSTSYLGVLNIKIEYN